MCLESYTDEETTSPQTSVVSSVPLSVMIALVGIFSAEE